MKKCEIIVAPFKGDIGVLLYITEADKKREYHIKINDKRVYKFYSHEFRFI